MYISVFCCFVVAVFWEGFLRLSQVWISCSNPAIINFKAELIFLLVHN